MELSASSFKLMGQCWLSFIVSIDKGASVPLLCGEALISTVVSSFLTLWSTGGHSSWENICFNTFHAVSNAFLKPFHFANKMGKHGHL